MMVTNPFGEVLTVRDEDAAASRILVSGSRLGRYEVLTKVGQGGMASVWAARQHGERGFTKAVAVKTILPHLAGEQEFESLFLREARIASTIRHPNVCEVTDLGEEGGTLYMAMEWVNGDSLASVLHGDRAAAPLHWPLVARIIADACAGLHAAHTARDAEGQPMMILHRDISPQNVLISESGIVKLADFGIAKASMSLSAMTRAGFMRGKVAYSAPERISGGAYDQRADIYALGCVLYELLTGHAPFGGRDDVRLLVDITGGRFRPIPAALDLPPELVRLVSKAIALSPEARVQSADSLRQALETILFERKCMVSSSHLAGLVRARLGPKLQARQRSLQATMERLSRKRSSEDSEHPRGAFATSASLPPPPRRLSSVPAASGRSTPDAEDSGINLRAGAPLEERVDQAIGEQSEARVIKKRGGRWLWSAAIFGIILSAAGATSRSALMQRTNKAAVSSAMSATPPAPSWSPAQGRRVDVPSPSPPPSPTASALAPQPLPAAVSVAVPSGAGRPPASSRSSTRTRFSAVKAEPHGDDAEPADTLQLNLPQVPSLAPSVSTPANPY